MSMFVALPLSVVLGFIGGFLLSRYVHQVGLKWPGYTVGSGRHLKRLRWARRWMIVKAITWPLSYTLPRLISRLSK